PVLLRSGGILPESLEDRTNGTDNPKSLRILFGSGSDGEYTLYEDDGISTKYREGAYVTTRILMEWKETGECTVKIDAAKGDTGLIPAKRTYELCIYGVEPNGDFNVACKDVSDCIYDTKKHCLTVMLSEKSVDNEIVVNIMGLKSAENDKKSEVVDILDRAWTVMEHKEKVFYELYMAGNDSDSAFLDRFLGLDIPELIKDAVREVFD
ncbi:MAG: DUF5110 domain-containing protein, partial [Lachnospiraceae bacterium]|nr:DUF5110 domain-containing protein [Lachnospiraceae bacterium]